MAKLFQHLGMLLCLLALMAVSRVTMAASAPTVSIVASPVFVTAGEQSRITWSSTNATQCVGTGNWTGVKPLADSKNTAHLKANETFTLTCTGPDGTASRTATVTVTGGAATSGTPTVTISANPSTVTRGKTTTISWSSTNTSACRGTGAWTGSEATSGSKPTGAITKDLTFALSCSGSGGTVSQSATVTVAASAAAATGEATLSWSAPTSNTNGTAVSLSGYHLYYGNSASSLTNSIAISGANNTSYEISGLTAGTWYFAVAADTSDGVESAQSAVGSKTI